MVDTEAERAEAATMEMIGDQRQRVAAMLQACRFPRGELIDPATQSASAPASGTTWLKPAERMALRVTITPIT